MRVRCFLLILITLLLLMGLKRCNVTKSNCYLPDFSSDNRNYIAFKREETEQELFCEVEWWRS